MTETNPDPVQALLRENAYLKTRVAQLTGDVSDLSSQVNRLQEEMHRQHMKRLEVWSKPDQDV